MEIDELKAQLRIEFDMKNFEKAKKIIGMVIQIDKRKGTVCLI